MKIAQSARSRVQPASTLVLAGCVAVSISFVSVAGCSSTRPTWAQNPDSSSSPEGLAQIDPQVVAFYRDRHFRPLWTSGSALKPEATSVVSMIAGAAAHGLDPARYRIKELEAAVSRAGNGDPAALRRADFLLSDAYAHFMQDIRRPPETPRVFYVDSELKPRGISKRDALDALTSEPSLAKPLEAANHLNPFYDDLRGRMAAQLNLGTQSEQLERLRSNLNNARLLPSTSSGRYVVVDAAVAKLWMVENGRIVDSMRVIVGKPGYATPMMAGLLRYAVLNPYWHIPPDLVPTRVAARVLRDGPEALKRDRLEIVSDWEPLGRRIEAAEVNWPAVATGQERLRVRQLPGAHNMMGAVKFMMPNPLGIYLHDTPDKSLFARADRRLSSGCVRLQDAARFERWLFGGPRPSPSGIPEERAYLPRPIPVFITYLS